MNDLWRLLRIQLLGFFDINIAFHTRDRKVRIKKLLLSGLMLLVFLTIMGMFFMYSYLLASQLKKFGMISSMEYVPGWMMAAASLATFFTTVYKTHGVLLGFKDYEQIMSLPIPVETVIASRILLLYLLNVFYTLIIMIPAGIVYIMEGEPLTSFYVLFPVTLLFVPLVPIVAAAGLGIGISMISSRFKHRNAVTLVTSFLLVIGILAFSSGAEEMAIDFKTVSDVIMGALGSVYPLAILYMRGVCRGDWMAASLFIGVSILVFTGLVLLLRKHFLALNARMTAQPKTADYRLQSLKTGTPFWALYRKEILRYGASPLYVLNTSMGTVLGILFCISFAFFGQERTARLLELPGGVETIRTFAPMVAAGFMVLACTTDCAISLEGKSLWIMKSIPAEPFTILMSKVAVNLTIQLPAVLICGLSLTYALKPGPFEILLLFLMPAAYGVFIALTGLIINLKNPNFQWTTETVVIKQSMAVLMALVVGMLSIALPVGVMILLVYLRIPLSALAFLWNVTLLTGFLDFVLLYILKSNGARWINAL